MAVSSRGVGEVICDLLGHEEETIVARAAEAGISLTGMSRLRLIAGPPQLLLGASFPPDAMRRAVEGLAALLG
jgi:hypothetical protein